MNLRVLGIVPARGGSKAWRTKICECWGKATGSVGDRGGSRVSANERLVVSSDDDEVLNIAAKYDPSLPLRRPAEFCTDTSPAIDYVRHALATLEKPGDGQFDAIAIIQPSSPFTTAADIDATIDLLQIRGRYLP